MMKNDSDHRSGDAYTSPGRVRSVEELVRYLTPPLFVFRMARNNVDTSEAMVKSVKTRIDNAAEDIEHIVGTWVREGGLLSCEADTVHRQRVVGHSHHKCKKVEGHPRRHKCVLCRYEWGIPQEDEGTLVAVALDERPSACDLLTSLSIVEYEGNAMVPDEVMRQ